MINRFSLFLLAISLSIGIFAQEVYLQSDYPAAFELNNTSVGASLNQEVTDTLALEELYITSGADIQAAIDSLYKRKGGIVILGAGRYVVTEAIQVYSDIHLTGAADLQPSDVVITIEDATYNEPIIVCEEALINFSIKNLKVQGNLVDSEQHLDGTYHTDGLAAADPAIRSDLMGILLTADGDTYSNAESSDILLDNVEISNCAMGIHIKGARDVRLTNMNVHHNGMIEGYYHNLYFRRVFMFTIEDSQFHNSLTGNGMNVSQSEDVTLRNNNCYDNYFRGFRIEGESGFKIYNILVEDNTATGNGFSSEQPGIRIRNVINGLVQNNTSTGNYSNTNFGGNSGITFKNNSWQ